MILTEEMLSNVYETYVTNYIDGDTLDMNINLGFDTYVIRRIRLLEIDAPEINNTKKTSEEHKAGEVATETLKYWFVGGTPPYYLKAEYKGIYGRWLGEIWKEVGQESLNDFMKSKGYGNGNWTLAVQQALIEAWYDSPEFRRYGKFGLLGEQSASLNKKG